MEHEPGHLPDNPSQRVKLRFCSLGFKKSTVEQGAVDSDLLCWAELC